MANAGEKLKNFGLRFGDKIAVLLAAGLFALCLFKALTRETIDVQPEQIKKAAEQSDSNLRRKVPTEEIVQTLVDGGIKQSDFAKEAETSSQMVLVASDFQPRREWMTPEPGAGLIRDQPNLIAPENVYAYPSRGAALVYALDSEGNRVVETETKEPPKSNIFRSRRRRGGMGMMGSDSGMGGMMGPGMGMGMGGQASPEQEKQAKAEYERKRKEMMAKLAGPSGPKKEKPEDALNKPQGPPPKEITKGLRWVAVTATLNHEQMLENYRQALKNTAIAQPHYRRLDVQRKTKQQDGTWTEWADVDAERNLTVLDNLPMEDEELTPDNVRPTDLNDPLPFLTAGLWEKVHIASLVPDEVKNIPDPTKNPAMMGGMDMMGPGMGGSSMMPGMDPGMMNSGIMMGGMMGKMGMMEGSGMMGMDGMGMGMGMGMGGMGGPETLSNFWRSEEKTVMVRALDFTAQPDESYRYRVRIVVFNPNFNRDDIAPGVDSKSEELQGPWSVETDEVHMPPDVTAYAMGYVRATPKSMAKGAFQIVKFNPEDGLTLPRPFEAAPGESLGEVRTTRIPTSDGTGAKNKGVDFSSQLMLLDVTGDSKPLPAGFVGSMINPPISAALLRPDGVVELHDEADDRPNEIRKDVESNYKRELKESDKIRSSSMGSGYDMMGGMMGSGMMGSGMMGGSR